MRVLAFVSFDPASGAVKTHDPEAFVDAAKLEEWAHPGSPKLRKKEKTLRETGGTTTKGSDAALESGFVNSMVSASEEDADIVTAMYVAEAFPAAGIKLRLLVASLIARRKFELPIKLLLHPFGASFLDQSVDSSGESLRTQLANAIERADRKDVPETILEAYTIATRLSKLVKQHP